MKKFTASAPLSTNRNFFPVLSAGFWAPYGSTEALSIVPYAER